MKKKLMILIISLVVLGGTGGILTAVLVPNKYERVNNAFENIIEFNSATSETTLTAGNYVISYELVNYSKEDSKVKYESSIKELSSDLTAEEQFVTVTNNGSFDMANLGEYLPVNFKIDEDSVLDFSENDGTYTFTIVGEYLVSVFGYTEKQAASISAEGVKVEVVVTDKMVTSFNCSYVTKSNIVVLSTVTIK